MRLLLLCVVILAGLAGYWYLHWAGHGKFATNQPGEFESLRIKAEKGDAEAEFDVGRCYQNSWEVRQDRAEALKWYEKSAELRPFNCAADPRTSAFEFPVACSSG
jgi:hypothetical protein